MLLSRSFFFVVCRRRRIGPAELSDRAGGGRMALSLGLGTRSAVGGAVGGEGGVGSVVGWSGIGGEGSFTLNGSGLLSRISRSSNAEGVMSS